MVHTNSTLSFQEHKETGRAEAWRKRVFDVFNNHSDTLGLTDREVMMILNVIDPSLVRPEISRLIDDGILVETGKTKCFHTLKTVRVCQTTGAPYFSRGNKRSFFDRNVVKQQESPCLA